MAPSEFIPVLDALFFAFDRRLTAGGVEKIKTIGDAYMAVAGIPGTRTDHADACMEIGLEMIQIAATLKLGNEPIQLRVGIHSGPVVAGVIGSRRMHYDMWGHTVNVASRLQSLGEPGTIHLSANTRNLLDSKWRMERSGTTEFKGVGIMETWLIRPS